MYVKTKKPTRYNVNLSVIWSQAWSPNGIDIAFVAAKDGYSDIYLLNVETGDLRNITDDPFSDAEPSWSPDGNRIAFTSDRQDYITRDMIPADFKMQDFDFYHQDIYIMDADGSNMERITDTPWAEGIPRGYLDGMGLAMVSQEVGRSKIYL